MLVAYWYYAMKSSHAGIETSGQCTRNEPLSNAHRTLTRPQPKRNKRSLYPDNANQNTPSPDAHPIR